MQICNSTFKTRLTNNVYKINNYFCQINANSYPNLVMHGKMLDGNMEKLLSQDSYQPQMVSVIWTGAFIP